MVAGAVHPDLVEALARFDAGDPGKMIGIGLRSRSGAHDGDFCKCDDPIVPGDQLMCEACLKHNQDAERVLLFKMASSHELVEAPPWKDAQRKLGMCALCTEFANHPVHNGGAKTMKTLWGETIVGEANA